MTIKTALYENIRKECLDLIYNEVSVDGVTLLIITLIKARCFDVTFYFQLNVSTLF